MKLRELLGTIYRIQQKIGTSSAYICGGIPRDRYMKQLDNVSDLDITTGDNSVEYLASEFGLELKKKYNVSVKSHDDGHTSIHLGSFKIDFSSNFNVPNIDSYLKKLGIEKPTALQREVFSRDFTCNSLLLSLDLKKLLDPTKNGTKDIDSKIIRTCLPPEITLTSNKNRVIRAIYLASKLDFDIDPKIIEFVQKNPVSVKFASNKTLVEKLNSSFEKDADKASYYITKMNLWEQIPITETVQPYYLKKTNPPLKKAYFQGGGGVNKPTPKKKKYKSDPKIVDQTRFKEPFYKNYDIYDIPGFEHVGPGAGWHSMQKYKSVSEFLKAKRKKMKDKYKADDSWVQDSGKITKQNPNIQTRAQLLSNLIKNGIDFPLDQYIDPALTAPDGGVSDTDTSVGHASLQGGYLDEYLPENDFEGKSPDALNFGRDYVANNVIESLSDIKHIEDLLEKYLGKLYGLPDGVLLEDDDLGTPNEINPDYGTLGPESLIYEDKWNI